MWRQLVDGTVRVDGICDHGCDMGGIGSDSSSSMGAGSMMGQTDMGTMTWQLTENGSTVTGPMRFSGSGMQERTAGSFLGTMSGDDMTFSRRVS